MICSIAERTLRAKVQQLGCRFRALEERLARENGPLVEQPRLELQLMLSSHVELRRKLDRLNSAPEQKRHRIISTLRADLDGLIRSLEAWFARQDQRFISSLRMAHKEQSPGLPPSAVEDEVSGPR